MTTKGVFQSSFANNIFIQKYSMNGQETWADTCKRVVDAVTGQLLPTDIKEELYNAMVERKFIPGGRYLYSAGREFHAVNNCYLFRAEDSREGWADLMFKSTASLMTGGGIGVDYSLVRPEGAVIRKTGGTSTGPLALMNMVNEAGRNIMQGGQRRSAIWAGLNWGHSDTKKFIHLKDWSEEAKALKAKDFNFPMPMEGTNISVIYDTEFFIAVEDKKHPKHKQAMEVWMDNCRQAFSTAEPGMGFNFCKDSESLRNAPVSSDTWVLTEHGYKQVGYLVGVPTSLWTGKQWSPKVSFKKTATNVETLTVLMTGGREITCDPTHPFIVNLYSGQGKRRKLIAQERVQANKLQAGDEIATGYSEAGVVGAWQADSYMLGFMYGDGHFTKYGGEVTLCTDEKKALRQHFPSSRVKNETITDGRGYHRVYTNFGYFDKDELPDVDWLEAQSFIAGLFDADGSYDDYYKRIRLSSTRVAFLKEIQRQLETLGIMSHVNVGSVGAYKGTPTWMLVVAADYVGRFQDLIPCKRLKLDTTDYKPYRKSSIKVKAVESSGRIEDVYCVDVECPEHTFMAEGVLISNCCEVTSSDDSDKCNLGTVWMNRCADKEEFGRICFIATIFLLCGGVYSQTPFEKIREVGSKNNRIGLGLGGMHEWLMSRGMPYSVTTELHKWLNVYERESDSSAYVWSKNLDVSIPKGKRAIAPTGTIGIIAETTTGIEPLFCKAFKRRYLNKDQEWVHEFVVDGSVKRLLNQGIKLEHIKDSYDISFGDRVKFQADVQQYVDMAISSTCNMAQWGSPDNNEDALEKNAKTLLKYAKRLRGFTCYPDAARGGQPLTRVDLDEALKNEGTVFEEREAECVGGVCGV